MNLESGSRDSQRLLRLCCQHRIKGPKQQFLSVSISLPLRLFEGLRPPAKSIAVTEHCHHACPLNPSVEPTTTQALRGSTNRPYVIWGRRPESRVMDVIAVRKSSITHNRPRSQYSWPSYVRAHSSCRSRKNLSGRNIGSEQRYASDARGFRCSATSSSSKKSGAVALLIAG